jgi:hypothetical protein
MSDAMVEGIMQRCTPDARGEGFEVCEAAAAAAAAGEHYTSPYEFRCGK